MATEQHSPMKRRTFLKTSALAAASLSILPARTVFGAKANEKIRLGLIGCGGRGNWVADLFEKNTNAKIVAVHDYFRDKVNAAGDKFGVDASRRYIGLDGYKALLASDVDAVAIESPPCFHAEQTVAALNAGKHAYLAKPIAVDAAGCVAIMEAASAHEGKLSCWVDFQTRNNEYFKGAAQRVHDGMIGDIVFGQAFYHAGRLEPQATPGTETARLRNWVFDKALSGDIIVEQNIHVIDVANWYLGTHPLKASGTGGRKARVDVGDCWDHFVVTYTYPDDRLIDFSSGQFINGFDDLCIRVYGSLGTVDSHYGGKVLIRGKKEGWRGGETTNIYTEGAVNNMKDFCKSITDGQFINNAKESAQSTLTAIMGRIAAYENRVVTWDEMMATAATPMDLRLNLPENGPDIIG